MRRDLQALKASVDFKALILESRDIDRRGNVICPAHDDHSPSCHIYPDHFHCFSCGAHGDHIDWLELAFKLDTQSAILELERRAALHPTTTPPQTISQLPRAAFTPVSHERLERHRRLAATLARVPSSMEGRGFSLDDLRTLGFAAQGDDAVFPITDPEGVIMALKRRRATSLRTDRYVYEMPGHGTPPWCSPGFLERSTVLIIEGELNAMACWIAEPHLAVMGVAGASVPLRAEALEGRDVYIGADDDKAGKQAVAKWAQLAIDAMANSVHILTPWPKDACEVAGQRGHTELANLIEASLLSASEVTTLGAKPVDGTTIHASERRSLSRRKRLSRWFW
jgi:putative DNA primase/helicase